jgi:hypothetical protein
MADILTDALQRPADAHHFHELENGPDPDRPRWCAEHMTRTLGEGGYPPSGSAPPGVTPPTLGVLVGCRPAGRIDVLG